MPSSPASFPAPVPAVLIAPVPAVALDAARERVVRLLTDRYADDTLTVEAFEAQLERMHALQSPAALDAMARELGAPAAPAHHPASFGERLARYAGGRLPGVLPARVGAFMSNTKRGGAWVVPPHLRLSSVMSEIELDLRDAVLPPVCEVDVYVLMGTVKLMLPPGVEALVEVDSFMASVDDRRRGRLPDGFAAGRGVLVRLVGSVIMGELKVRREDW